MSKEGLEALKEHKLVLKQLGHNYCDNWGNLIVIEKELKALEIIREKYVDVAVLKNTENVEQYNNTILLFFKCSKELTKEEYDLLKEVL